MITLLKFVLLVILENVFRLLLENISECKACNIESVLKRYFIDTGEILQQRRDKNALFEDLDNRLKTLEEKLSLLNLTTSFVDSRFM